MCGINDKLAIEEIRDKQMIDERQITEKPWLATQWAGRAESPGLLDERADLLLSLARLPLKKQAVAISRCADRDKLVEHLLVREEFGAALNLLHGDLSRWLPDVSEFSDLKWLLAVLLQVKTQSAGKKARVVWQTSSGVQIRESAAMLEAFMEDALAAAAAAWVRCLCGPGGDHQVLEMPLVMADPELGEAIISELARDPRALALLVEEVRLRPAGVGLSRQRLPVLLQKGAQAARYCYDTITAGLSDMGA
ncbi:hypothetical protein [Desulfoscipio sp. XC116]|uniref:hypothetical protein n=1 Tax=Desulfoscipio sp. XC116 TaxID=3144975 RepID=UPI00325B40B3